MPRNKWPKGISGNPKGRTPILLPALQKEIDANKNAIKQLILTYFSLTKEQFEERQRQPNMPMAEAILGHIMEKAYLNGDFIPFKALLEIPLGKLPEDKADFDVSPEEKELIIEYRKRLNERESKDSPKAIEGSDSTKDSK